jgi:hypothetical protein
VTSILKVRIVDALVSTAPDLDVPETWCVRKLPAWLPAQQQEGQEAAPEVGEVMGKATESAAAC